MPICCSALELNCMTEFCRCYLAATKQGIRASAFAHLVHEEKSEHPASLDGVN